MAGVLRKIRWAYVRLGLKSLGILELTSLPSLDRNDWVPMVEEADALLVWGGDPVYLSHWMRQSGLTSLLPSLRKEAVYVGVSAGSMAAATTFAETYTRAPIASPVVLASETIVFSSPQGKLDRLLVTAHGAGITDFAVIPHLDNDKHPDASLANAQLWAAKLSVPVYAIDDQTAIKVIDGNVEIISEGHWKLFNQQRESRIRRRVDKSRVEQSAKPTPNSCQAPTIVQNPLTPTNDTPKSVKILGGCISPNFL